MKTRKSFDLNIIQLYIKGEYFLIKDFVRIKFKDQEIIGCVVDLEQKGEFQRLYISPEVPLVLEHIGTAYED